MLGLVFRDTAKLAGIAKTVTFVAFLKWDAAGSGSLLCLAGSTHKPLPVVLLFRGDVDPLLEWAVVDGGCVLIDICRIRLIPVFYFPFDYLLCFVTSVKLANILFSDTLVSQLDLRYLCLLYTSDAADD